MVYVRLDRDWVDGTGIGHGAGDMIDVDAGTLAELEARGIVVCPAETGTVGPDVWAGPGSPDRG